MAPHTINTTLKPLGQWGKRPQNLPLPLESRGPPSNTWMSVVTPLTVLNDSLIAARTSAQLCNKVTRLGTPSRTFMWRQNVTFIEPDMWPPNSPDLNPVNYTIWVVLHFLLYAVYICQKSLSFAYAFKCYQQNCSWLHFTWTTLYSKRQKLVIQLL